MTLEQTFVVILNMLVLSVAAGLIIAILVQPRRDRISYLFACFSGALALWAVTALVVQFQPLDFWTERRLLATAIILTTFTYVLFGAIFTGAGERTLNVLIPLAMIAVLGGIALVWVGPVFTATGLTLPGNLLLGVLLGFGALPLWLAISIRGEQPARLRLPALVVLLALVTVAIPPLNRFLVGVLLTTLGALGIAWTMLRLQLFNPLNEVSAELRTANRDLRQALSDLSNERARLDALRRELLDASGYKGEFLANMSHKLRTPLYSIAGYTELLQGGIYGDLNEKQLDRLEKIQRNSKTLLDLINNMLDLSKIEAGRLELNATVVRLDGLVARVTAAVEPQLVTKPVRLRVDLEPKLALLFGDEQRIQQIVLQLIDNALKFTEQGEIEVLARNVPVENGQAAQFKLPFNGWLTDGDWVILSVADTGIGIAPENQARIFDEFYQVDEQRSSELGGTGLGLHICKRLVEMHRGVIWVRSQVNRGSTFYVALPAYREARATQPGTTVLIS